MAKAVHAMVRVLDEARSVDFYARAFGLDVADRIDFETFTLVYMKNAEADFEVELTVNKGRTEPYDLGDGYGHVAQPPEDVRPDPPRAPRPRRDECRVAGGGCELRRSARRRLGARGDGAEA